MPYIDLERRQKLDNSINQMILSLKELLGAEDNLFNKEKISNEEFVQLLGDLNYCFSRVLSGLMTNVSYSKIAMITGVLENIKQEYYRRVAVPYEDKKIDQNGDIKEYLKNPPNECRHRWR